MEKYLAVEKSTLFMSNAKGRIVKDEEGNCEANCRKLWVEEKTVMGQGKFAGNVDLPRSD